MPRSAIIWTRSRELSLKARYHLTHRMMISWSKCRPLNRSCAEVGSAMRGVTAASRVFQVCTRTIKGFKTSHFLEQKTAPQDHPDAGPMGHVERPQSESASNDLQFTRPRLVPAADRTRAWGRSRDS